MTQIDDLSVFRLLGIHEPIGKKFCNPFRNDKKPDAKLREYNGRVYLIDFASDWNGLTGIDCFARINNLSFVEAIKLLQTKNEFAITNNFQTEYVKSEPINVTIVPIFIDFSKRHLNYWHNLGVTNFENIYAINSYQLIHKQGDEIISNKVIDKKSTLTFAYKFELNNQFYWKIYSPFEKSGFHKWAGNVPKDANWLKKGTINACLINKSSKDFKVVESLLNELNLNISVTHFQSENIKTNKNGLVEIPMVDVLCKYEKLYHIWDNDKAGIENSNKLNYLSTPIFVPKEHGKDMSNLYMKKGENYCLNFLKENIIC